MRHENKFKLEETLKCPKCKSKNLTRDSYRAELVCNDCGLVIDEGLIDYSPEWRAFDNEQREKRARTGSPITPLIHDKGLSTTISWQNRDSYGKTIPARNRGQIYRLRKWHKRTRISDSTGRNLAQALSVIARMSSAMGLPRTIRENAALIYRSAATRNLIRGRSIEGIAAAAIYAASRRCDIPRTLDEISSATNIPRKEIGRNYRYLARELELKLRPTTPHDYITRFSNDLKLSGKTRTKALKILETASEKELTAGRGPTGIAAAALYIASVLCDERRTQKEVAEASGVTEVTIRNRYKELSEKLNIEITL